MMEPVRGLLGNGRTCAAPSSIEPKERLFPMNTEILRGRWTQVKVDSRKKWGRLTDNYMRHSQGDDEKMIGKLQERYGYRREQAEKELTEFLNPPAGQPRRTA